jgi:hypothetical protein
MEKSKKIFVLILPDHGHINPVACVVSELKKKYTNYEIIFYANETFKGLIERTGCTYREYSYCPPDEGQPPLKKQKGFIFSFIPIADLCTRLLKLSDRILPELIADVEREKPDLIIYDVFALHAKYLLRSLELRYKRKISDVKPPRAIMFATTFAQKLGVFPTISQLNQIIRLNLGFFLSMLFLMFLQIRFSWKHALDFVDIVSLLTSHDEQTVIVTIFPEFQPKRDKFGEVFKFVGSCIAENVRKFEVNDPRLQSMIDSFRPVNPLQSTHAKPSGDSKLIYASMGTVANNNIFIFEHIIDMMKSFEKGEKANANYKLIISTGKQVYEQFETKIKQEGFVVPENVVIQQTVPQIEILKRVSLFITHGGMNSTSEAILYAVPVVCIPIMVSRFLMYFGSKKSNKYLGIFNENICSCK